MAPLKGGLIYFALVFAAGFTLGTLRVLFLVPAVGAALAVLIELPVMLTVSWLACRFVVRRLEVAQAMDERIIMGAFAFVLLMAAEAYVAWLLGGRSISAYLANYVTLAGATGLAGQIAFAVFPAVQLLFPGRPGD